MYQHTERDLYFRKLALMHKLAVPAINL